MELAHEICYLTKQALINCIVEFTCIEQNLRITDTLRVGPLSVLESLSPSQRFDMYSKINRGQVICLL